MICNSVPNTRYTVLTTQTVVEMETEMINAFPSKNGISKKLGTATIFEGKEKINLGVRRIPFGEYAMVYTGTSNVMKSKSVPGVALSLRPMTVGNISCHYTLERGCTHTYGKSCL